jgi:hypothetical protein
MLKLTTLYNDDSKANALLLIPPHGSHNDFMKTKRPLLLAYYLPGYTLNDTQKQMKSLSNNLTFFPMKKLLTPLSSFKDPYSISKALEETNSP